MTDTDVSTTSEVVIKAISNEIRRNIIRLLIEKQLSYSEIAQLLNYELRKESGKFNFHLKELVQAGLINNETQEEKYQLTEKGKEIYYLLLDIEKDKEIDPHGLLTALIKLEGKKEFDFFLSSILVIGGIMTVSVGLLALLGLGDYTELRLLGGFFLLIGSILLYRGSKTYSRIINELLVGKSIGSKLVSTIFLLNIEWYFIRGRHRMLYLFALLSTFIGWSMGLVSALLSTASYVGAEQIGSELVIFISIAAGGLVGGSFMLQRLHSFSQTSKE